MGSDRQRAFGLHTAGLLRLYTAARLRAMLDAVDGAAAPTGSTAWMDFGRCIGESSLFFAPFAERPEARVRREARARSLCAECEVLKACREYARRNRELGFWGGESESERAIAGFAPTTPIVGRKRVAEDRARDAMRRSR